ncbi:MAG TPA: alpha/beta hydrolase [Cytophagales bacterium]|nr:alpha/beta hydrolase [Cytophagales bacterium]
MYTNKSTFSSRKRQIYPSRTKLVTALALGLILALGGCEDGFWESRAIRPFSIENDTTISLNGVIDSNTLEAFNEVLRQNPNTVWLVFHDAPGSEDDETNLQVGRRLYELGMHTRVAANGSIASGAVDLFLAGDLRQLGSNAQVGVHSWSTGQQEATDFPRDSEEHEPYIQYYQEIGMDSLLAHEFYFFTIEAAPAADIHWMTPQEILTYEIENPQ